MEDLIEGHPEWAGLVQGLVINKKGAESGIYLCAQKTTLPIVQDNDSGDLWAALGAPYNGLVVVDATGKMALQLFPGSLPNHASDIELAVSSLLQ